jgi:LysR family transcriptional activator of nhaA
MYNYNHLYYFYITVKSGGVSAAANHLRISQPSLSSQLKVLEQSFDLRLFLKVGRHNELTDAGSAVFGFCKQMFEMSEEMESVFSKRIPLGSRSLHVGVSDELDRSVAVDIVGRFLKKLDRGSTPKVSIVADSHERLSDQLRFRELDVVLSEKALEDPELTTLEHIDVPIALACSPDWTFGSEPARSTKKLTLSHVAGSEGIQWLLPSWRYKLRAEIENYIDSQKLKGRVVLESDVLASLVQSTIDGIGLAFLPVTCIERLVDEKTLCIVGPREGLWKSEVWLSCHTQNRKDLLIKSLAQVFKSQLES